MGKLYNNGLPVGTGLKIDNPSPVDDKMYVQTFTDLAALANKYDGLVTRVQDQNMTPYIYRLATNTWETLPEVDRADFVLKAYFEILSPTVSSGLINMALLTAGQTNFSITTPGLVLRGLINANLNEESFEGKPYIIRNDSNSPIFLTHNDVTATTRFRFVNEQTLTIPVGGIVTFNISGGFLDLVSRSWNVDDTKQNIPIVRTSNFTPDINTINHVTANAIVTNPVGVEGLGYEIEVLAGNCTLSNGQSFAGGAKISAKFVSGSWIFIAYMPNGRIDVVPTANGTISTSVLWNGKIVRILNGAFTINIQVNHNIDCSGIKIGTGLVDFIAGSQTITKVNQTTALTGAICDYFSFNQGLVATNTLIGVQVN
jgi:hypothetical protein